MGLYFAMTVFSLVGLCLLLAAYYSGKRSIYFLKHAIKTQGKVIDNEKIESTRRLGQELHSSFSYFPIIEFIDNKGKTSQFRSEVGSAPPKFSVGENVEIRVLYDGFDIKDIRITSFFSLWGTALICSVIGSSFLLFSALMFTTF